MICITYLPQCFQFLLRIQCTIFCRLRNIDHTRLYHMWICLITKESFHVRCNTGSFQLAKLARNRNYFMSCCFNRTSFMHRNMTTFTGNHTLIVTKQCFNDSLVCLRSTNKKLYFSIFTATCFFNFFLC